MLFPNPLPTMQADLELARLSALLGGFVNQRLLVIGDLMLDEFIWGKVSRISPEAPVPVVNVVGETYYPGGAANVARNAREFGAQVAVMGLAGADGYGDRLLQLLQECGIDTAGVQRDGARPTTVKTRVIARNQQVVRVDRERPGALSAEQGQRATQQLQAAVAAVDAIVVADGSLLLTDWVTFLSAVNPDKPAPYTTRTVKGLVRSNL